MAKIRIRKPEIKIPDVFDVDGGVLIRYRGHDKEIIVPEGVKIIGKGVFSKPFGYGKAVRITVPEGVTEIQNDAFLSSDLEEIGLPSTLKIIGENAFSHCRDLHSVVIPEGVKEIRECAFAASGLEEAYLPKYLKFIGLRAFYECKDLKKITIPERKKMTIDIQAFSGCTGLLDENGFVIFRGKLAWFEPKTSDSHIYVEIPDQVTSIEDELFTKYPCVHLTMPVRCPEWNTYGEPGYTYFANSIIRKSGSTISFRDADGRIAAKVILATAHEEWGIERKFICSIRSRKHGGFDFEKYDSMFAVLAELQNKAAMALLRLKYPYELPKEMEKEYTAFLRENCSDICISLLEEELSVPDMMDTEILQLLEKIKAIDPDVIRELIAYAQQHGMNELIAKLLAYQKKNFGEEDIFGQLELPDDPGDRTGHSGKKSET